MGLMCGLLPGSCWAPAFHANTRSTHGLKGARRCSEDSQLCQTSHSSFPVRSGKAEDSPTMEYCSKESFLAPPCTYDSQHSLLSSTASTDVRVTACYARPKGTPQCASNALVQPLTTTVLANGLRTSQDSSVSSYWRPPPLGLTSVDTIDAILDDVCLYKLLSYEHTGRMRSALYQGSWQGSKVAVRFFIAPSSYQQQACRSSSDNGIVQRGFPAAMPSSAEKLGSFQGPCLPAKQPEEPAFEGSASGNMQPDVLNNSCANDKAVGQLAYAAIEQLMSQSLNHPYVVQYFFGRTAILPIDPTNPCWLGIELQNTKEDASNYSSQPLTSAAESDCRLIVHGFAADTPAIQCTAPHGGACCLLKAKAQRPSSSSLYMHSEALAFPSIELLASVPSHGYAEALPKGQSSKLPTASNTHPTVASPCCMHALRNVSGQSNRLPDSKAAEDSLLTLTASPEFVSVKGSMDIPSGLNTEDAILSTCESLATAACDHSVFDECDDASFVGRSVAGLTLADVLAQMAADLMPPHSAQPRSSSTDQGQQRDKQVVQEAMDHHAGGGSSQGNRLFMVVSEWCSLGSLDAVVGSELGFLQYPTPALPASRLGNPRAAAAPAAGQGPMGQLVGALRSVREASMGLLHLHSHGLVHGGLAPSNLLLAEGTSDGRGFIVKVADPGLVTVRCVAAAARATTNLDEGESVGEGGSEGEGADSSPHKHTTTQSALALDLASEVLRPSPPPLVPEAVQSRSASRFSLDGEDGFSAAAGPECKGVPMSKARCVGRSLRFTAPEVVAGCEPTAAGDVYSLGALLYYALYAQQPYQALADEKATACILAGTPPPPPKTHGSFIPSEIHRLLAACMSSNPSARPAMRAVAAELTCIEGALKRRTAYVAHGMHGMHGMIRQQHAAGMHGVCMAGANLRRDAAHALAVQMPRASTATGGVTAQAPFPPALTLVQQVQQTILPPMHLLGMLPSQQQMVLLPVVHGACTTLTTLTHVAVRLQQLQAAGT